METVEVEISYKVKILAVKVLKDLSNEELEHLINFEGSFVHSIIEKIANKELADLSNTSLREPSDNARLDSFKSGIILGEKSKTLFFSNISKLAKLELKNRKLTNVN